MSVRGGAVSACAAIFVVAVWAHGHPFVTAVLWVVSWCLGVVVAVCFVVVGAAQWLGSRCGRDSERCARAGETHVAAGERDAIALRR